jgi:hypothetical protein
MKLVRQEFDQIGLVNLFRVEVHSLWEPIVANPEAEPSDPINRGMVLNESSFDLSPAKPRTGG